jgi:hypothetical protein
MIRSFVTRASALLASATFAFLLISPSAISPATGWTLNVPTACSIAPDGSGNFTMTCGTTPPGALNCSIIGAPSGPVTAGAAVSLTMSCTGGTTPYRYLWTPGGGSSGTLSTTVAATTTYSVTATDNANATSTQGVTVTVSGGGGGGGGGTGFCSQYANVMPIITATWGASGAAYWYSSASGNFGDGNSSVWVVRLTVPAGTPNSTYTGKFSVAEYQGPSTFRQLTISTQACDFRPKDYTGANGPLAISNGTAVSIPYGVAAPFIFGPAGLTAGQTYYISVRNWQLDPSPQSSCLQTSCNALMNDDPALP